jgi:sec-independent protein translocase protein TatA
MSAQVRSKSLETSIMGSLSIWHWLIVGAVALLLFGGKGKISDIMGDVAKGIKSFKKGMQEEDESAAVKPVTPPTPAEPVRTIDHPTSVDRTPESHKVG